MTEVRVFQQELDLATRALAPATGMLAAADPIPAPGFAALEVFLYEDSLAEELQVRGPLLFVFDEAIFQHKIRNLGLFQAKASDYGL